MLSLSDGVRPYWAFGINNITSSTGSEFSKWLAEGTNYQIYNQIKADAFQISVSERRYFLEAICVDCSRFSMSCFETAIKVEELALLPKSISWLLVKLYYSAFYSSHYLLRLFGYSLTQLEKLATNKIESIAEVYGNKNGIEIQKGFYLFDYSDRSTTIKCDKLTKTGEDGSHGILWKLLSDRLRFMSNDMLLRNSSSDYQRISTKISSCVDNLHFMGSNNGGWLSRVRNDINYKHKYGTWFPYRHSERYYSSVKEYLDDWKGDPLEIDLTNLAGKELVRFIVTCQFLIGMAREVSIDMSKRCSAGRSFQTNGPISLLNHVKLLVKS